MDSDDFHDFTESRETLFFQWFSNDFGIAGDPVGDPKCVWAFHYKLKCDFANSVISSNRAKRCFSIGFTMI